MNKIIVTAFLFLFCRSVKSQNYRIGDLYTASDGSQGIVYYITPEGGGWVVALQDASEGCVWGSATDVPGLVNNHDAEYQQLMSDTAGYENTLILRNYQNNVNSASHVVDFVNGWVLPTIAQLSMLYGQLPFISMAIVEAGGTVPEQDNYWSSVENTATYAWRVQFTNGAATRSSKTNSCRVRAVRCFGNPALQYSWNNGGMGQNITVSPSQTTNYTVTVTTAEGQSVSASHTVVVACRDTIFLEETACDYYVWMGDTITHTGDYTRVFQNSAGMDSTVTLRLKIFTPAIVSVQSVEDTICAGADAQMQVVMESSTSSLVAVGDILCTDNTIVKPSEWPAYGKMALGVVFYVDYSGEHGWAVHLQEQHSAIIWGFPGIDIPSLNNIHNVLDANRDFNGYANTQKIRSTGNADLYPGVWTVDFDNGWYLPAAGQLSLLCAEWVILNSTLQLIDGSMQFPMNVYSGYWSSTEYGSATAWEVLYGGDMLNSSKNGNGRIRSIRDF